MSCEETKDDQQYDDAVQEMNATMMKLPDELTEAYRNANRFAPDVVKKESDPRWFLR